MKIEFLKEENKVIVDGVEYVRAETQYTFDVNGHEVPEPIREAPSKGQTYYVASTVSEDLFEEYQWEGDDIDIRLLNNGVVHLSEENAIAHTYALLSFTKTDK